MAPGMSITISSPSFVKLPLYGPRNRSNARAVHISDALVRPSPHGLMDHQPMKLSRIRAKGMEKKEIEKRRAGK